MSLIDSRQNRSLIAIPIIVQQRLKPSKLTLSCIFNSSGIPHGTVMDVISVSGVTVYP